MILAALDIEQFARVYFPRIADSLGSFGPELQVAVAAMAILVIDLFLPLKASRHLAWLALAACILPAISVLEIYDEERSLFLGMIGIDSFANFFKLFFLLGAIPVVLLSYIARELEGKRVGEYYAILLAAVLGGMLMASSTHFLMAFLSLELLSICSYILVGFHKGSRTSSEASLKYIIYGSVAAGVMGYGLSILYGLTGTADIRGAAEVLRGVMAGQGEQAFALTGVAALVGLLLTFLGLAYKMATIPMHFWCPDVYEGAPTPITAFLSVASKAAGFALALRFLAGFSETMSSSWPVVMAVVSIATMTLGNFAALWQDNLKRLFAYSSIAHAGYMMMGVAILGLPGAGPDGIQLIAYYLLAYLAMNLGAFAVVILIENHTGSVNLSEYDGMGWKAPFLGISLTVFLFSLIGVPPTAGFTGKFQLFMGVIDRAAAAGGAIGTLYYILAVAAVVNTAVSVYYYARIIKNMYLTDVEESAVERIRFPVIGTFLVAVFLAMTILLFLYADPILKRTLVLEFMPT